MFLGDSITFGVGNGLDGGYAGTLCRDTRLIRPIGTILHTMDPSTGPGYDHCEGHSGFTSIDITNGIASYIAAVGAPDIVLYNIGANDGFGTTPNQVPDNMALTFATLKAANPNVVMLMACPQCPPRSDNPFYGAWVTGAPVLAARIATIPGIVACPVGVGITDADMFDGLHPGPTGYAKMAAAWAATLRSLKIVI